MSENLPKAIQNEFTIQNKNIKYPTFPDQDFKNSILDDHNFNNYSEENTKKSFNEFITTFTNCKNNSYDIIERNLHNFNEYCSNLNVKQMYFIFYFYLLDKFINLLEKKYFKNELNENSKNSSEDDSTIDSYKNKNSYIPKIKRRNNSRFDFIKKENDNNNLNVIIPEFVLDFIDKSIFFSFYINNNIIGSVEYIKDFNYNWIDILFGINQSNLI